MMEKFFDGDMKIRLRLSEKEKIERIVKKNPDLFVSSSQFVRAAVIKLLREYENKK